MDTANGLAPAPPPPDTGAVHAPALLERAFTDPAGTLAMAASRLPDAGGAERVHLLRAMGNACRELRRVDEAVGHLEAAVAAAAELDDDALGGVAAMSLAAALSYDGDFARSLALGQRAVDLLTGDDHAIALSQLAGLLQRAGRHGDALRAFDAALDAAAGCADRTIEGDIWMNRGVLHGWVGEIDAAEADTCRALELFEQLGWTKRAADMSHNLAWLAGRRGDLVDAFRRFDEAERTYAALGMAGAAIFPDRAEALLAAGLAAEALALAERAVAGLRRQGDDVDLAEALMLVARAALLAGDPARAAEASAEAIRRFGAQDRGAWWAAAEMLHVDARRSTGDTDASDRARIAAVITAMDQADLVPVVAEARLVAADLAAADGDWPAARRQLAAVDRAALGLAARCRHDLLRVRELTAAGSADAALGACAAAVAEFGEFAGQLAGTELRAHIARHVAELVDAGLALTVGTGDAAAVFTWSERQRASALGAVPVRPPEDVELARELDRLRAALTRLDAASRDGHVDPELTQLVEVQQDRVRRRARHATDAMAALRPATIADVGEHAAWVSYAEVDGGVLAVRVVDGEAAIIPLGRAAEVARETTLLEAMLAMHLGARGRGVDRDPTTLHAAAAAVDDLVVAPLELPPGPVTISPIGGLHDLPWALLPSLRGREFSLAPSVAVWSRCRTRTRATDGDVVAIAGPGVPHAAAEAAAVAGCHAEATILAGGDATVTNATVALSGAGVAHLACHGRFTRGNPMFSSLLLADGPMFVYDLERVDPPPAVVVLSACHAGAHATPSAREVLGVTAALLARGPRAVIAATVPIPDTPATVSWMERLHRRLADGAPPAAALAATRAEDPVLGGAFACHGAG